MSKWVEPTREHALWLADKLAGSDYVQEAAAMLRKWPAAPALETVAVQEATPAMLEAGAMEIAMNEQRVVTAERKAEDVWQAMMRAAPLPVAPKAEPTGALWCDSDIGPGEPVKRAPKPSDADIEEAIAEVHKRMYPHEHGYADSLVRKGIQLAQQAEQGSRDA